MDSNPAQGMNAATAALFAATEQHGFQDPVCLPRDAKLLSLLIQAEGVKDYDTKTIPQLLEFMHRYILDVAADAQVFAEHASRKDIAVDDVKLAIAGRVASSFTAPPGRAFNAALADEINQRPLLPVPSRFGVRLPPEQYTLGSTNFQIAVDPIDPATQPTVPVPTLQTAPHPPVQQQQQQQQQLQQQQEQQQQQQVPHDTDQRQHKVRR